MDRVLKRIKITDAGCWEYQGAKTRNGYGNIGRREGGRLINHVAHRFVYEKMVGKIPEGMQANHKCDNRICCNPAHIFIGTQKDNMEDAYAKGRVPRNPHEHKNWWSGGPEKHARKGEQNGRSILDRETVKYIRHLYYAERHNQVQLGKHFGVCRTQIGRIVKGVSWR